MFRATFCPSSGALLNCSRSLMMGKMFVKKQTTARNTSTLASIREPEAAAAVQKCS
jgi:hypothetical protein